MVLQHNSNLIIFKLMIIQRVSVMFSNQTIAFEEKLSHTQKKNQKALGLFRGPSIILNRKILESLTKKVHKPMEEGSLS